MIKILSKSIDKILFRKLSAVKGLICPDLLNQNVVPEINIDSYNTFILPSFLNRNLLVLGGLINFFFKNISLRPPFDNFFYRFVL